MSDTHEDLLAELKWLRHNQADLDLRLRRVEDSLVFRGLRAVGTFYQSNFRSEGSGSVESYRAWARSHLRRGNAAIAQSLLDVLHADYVTESPVGVMLEPDALGRAAEAIQVTQPALIYFDHQIIDESGDPVRPVFKPDWSPVLAESCDYMGPFVLKSREPRQGILHIPHIGYSVRAGLTQREIYVSPSTYPLVSILICTRNADLLARCLSALRARTVYPSLEIIVIHHMGSEHDEDIGELARQGGARIVPFTGAFNFSVMNNLGARAANGEILLFLNDDVEPLEAKWLERMAGRLERAETGVVGAKLLYYNGSIQHAGLVTWEMGGAGHPGRFLESSTNWPWLDMTREVTAVTGACLALRRADFEIVGGFDPIFPVNFNDVDLCLRLREHGLMTILETGAVLQHDEGQTRSSGVSFEERRLFYLRWYGRLEKTDPFYSPNLVQNDESLGLRE